MSTRDDALNRSLFLLFPACTMSLGWAFRGFIGGGPLGAMIPGAMVAIAVAWLLGRQAGESGVVAAFGAIGVGFGGQMTYGQTVGLASDSATMPWGLLGLALKGAIWGLLGGTVIGLAFTIRRYTRVQVAGGLVLMLAATWAGWRFVNLPKLIYFSNRFDRPREELWAGLLAGAIVLLGCLLRLRKNAPLLRFALASFAGGGLGFGLGGALLAAGRNSPLDPAYWPWWKGMEYTFGLLFGLAIGWAAWRSRDELAGETPAPHAEPLRGVPLLLAVILAIGVGLSFEYAVPLRFNFSVIGAGLLVVALCEEALAWHVAVTMTYFAFAVDLAEAFAGDLAFGPMWVGWVFATTTSLLVWYVLEAWREGEIDLLPRAFLLVTLSAFAVASAKTAMQILRQTGPHVEYPLFVLATALVCWLFRRWQQRMSRASFVKV